MVELSGLVEILVVELSGADWIDLITVFCYDLAVWNFQIMSQTMQILSCWNV